MTILFSDSLLLSSQYQINELMMLESNQSLMVKAQKTLLNQLKLCQTNVSKDLSIKVDHLKSKSNQYQITFIRISGIEKDLLRIQNQDKSTEIATCSDGNIESISLELDDNKFLLRKSKIQRDKCFVESNKLLKSIVDVEIYWRSLKDKALFATISTDRVDRCIRISEASKEQQDSHIYALTQQLEKIMKEIVSTSDEKVVKESEILSLVAIFKDLDIYQCAVASDKNVLHKNWKDTLKAIGKRDESIHELISQSKLYEDDYRKSKGIINRSKHDINVAQELYQDKNQLMKNMKKGVSASEEKINSLKAMFGDVNLNLSASTELLAKLKHHENTVETTNANLASESARFATMIPSLMEQCHATNAELEIVNLSKLNTTDNIKNLNARKARILALSHKIDVDTFALEREISICHSANSSKSAVLIAINEESMTGEADLREKERIIDMYQSSLKQRNELVEKKVSQSEYLRKKFTAIIEESRGAENLDTFDNRLKNLETVVDQVIEDCNRLENSWLSSQTELVSLVHESEECLSQKRLLKAKACVLKQQKQRLLGYLVDCNADIKHSKQSSEKLQQEISKLNCSFSLHKEKVLDIQSKCFSSKRSHEDKLDELYGLLKEMNDRAVQVRDMTQDLLQETSQLNESTSRCESNIQSTKTIRASNALDNTVETDDLELDLRNISQRLDSARRFQNSLCNAIENVVLKRKEITNSFTSSSLASDNRPASKRLASLTSDIAEIASKSTKAYEMFRSKVLVIEGVEKQLVSLKPLIHSSMSKAQILVDTVAYKKVEVRILQSTNSSKLQYLSNLLSKRGKNMKRTRSHNGQLLSNVKVAVKEIRDNCCHSNAVVSSLDTLSGAVNL